jgi:hypothetical protein
MIFKIMSENRETINQLHKNMDSHVNRDNLYSAEELKSDIETEGEKVIHIEDSEEKYVIIVIL